MRSCARQEFKFFVPSAEKLDMVLEGAQSF